MKRLLNFLFLTLFFCSIFGCVAKETAVQENSDKIETNALNINDLTKIVNDELENEKTAKLLGRTEFDLELAIENALKKKGLIDAQGILKTAKPVVQAAGGFLGIPPVATELGLAGLLTLFGGDKLMQRRRRREKALADADPETANKMLT